MGSRPGRVPAPCCLCPLAGANPARLGSTHFGVGVWEVELIQTVLPRVQEAAHGQGPVSTGEEAGEGQLRGRRPSMRPTVTSAPEGVSAGPGHHGSIRQSSRAAQSAWGQRDGQWHTAAPGVAIGSPARRRSALSPQRRPPARLRPGPRDTHKGWCRSVCSLPQYFCRNFSALSVASTEPGWLATARFTTCQAQGTQHSPGLGPARAVVWAHPHAQGHGYWRCPGGFPLWGGNGVTASRQPRLGTTWPRTSSGRAGGTGGSGPSSKAAQGPRLGVLTLRTEPRDLQGLRRDACSPGAVKA